MGFKHIVHHVKELPNLQNAISKFKRNSELLSSNGLIRNDFIKLIRVGNYIRHKWVNHIDQRVKSALLTYSKYHHIETMKLDTRWGKC